VDRSFWTRIVKNYEKEGVYSDGPRVTGWVCKFVPYMSWGPPNEIAEGKLPEYAGDERMKAVSHSGFDYALSEAPFTLKYHSRKHSMVLVSGLVGVRQQQHGDSCAVRPEVGWAIVKEKLKNPFCKGREAPLWGKDYDSIDFDDKW
jgi:hypothetical protein